MPSKEDQERLDAFFAEADDIIENWQPGFDSATWAADGSHQPDEIGGDYYAEDVYRQRLMQHPGAREAAAPHLHEERRRRGFEGVCPTIIIIDEMTDMLAPVERARMLEEVLVTAWATEATIQASPRRMFGDGSA